MITEAELHDAFHDRLGPALAGLNPGPAMLESLQRRVRRRNRLTVVGAAAGVVAIVAAMAGVTQLTSSPGRVIVSTGQPSGLASLPSATTATVPLMTSGECAGLAVTAANQDIADKRTLAVTPGIANAITMPGNDLMYLQATGPCVGQLTFLTSGNLQGPDPDATVSAFNSQHIGVVISKAAGRGTIELLLRCDPTTRSGCPATSTQLAAITVTVTAPNGATGTQKGRLAPTSVITTVPDVRGLPAGQASSTLRAAGFVVQEASVSSSVASGVVVAQQPLPGVANPSGGTVTIDVSSGAAPSP